MYNVGILPVRHEDISGSIKGRLTIYNHLKEVLENAKKEVIICTSASEIQSKSRFFSSVFDRLKKANISMKVALSGDEKDIKKINNKFKIKAKAISIDAKFFVADNEQVLFIISKGGTPDEEIAIWLNTPFFTTALAFMFNEAMKGSED